MVQEESTPSSPDEEAMAVATEVYTQDHQKDD
jgi:hypothetical protein